MKTLLLLRHAKSDWADAGLSDKERPLNARGIDDAQKIGKWISKNHNPDHVFCSSSNRTLSTHKLLGIDAKLEANDALYLASDAQIMSLIQACDDQSERLLVIGHNPGITDLANLFLNSDEGYLELKTAACAVFEFNVNSWSKISRRNAELIDFAVGKKE